MIFQNNIALVGEGSVAISFGDAGAGTNAKLPAKGTVLFPQKLKTDLKVAPWGGDNQYPQNVTEQLSTCGVARSALDFKARALYGQGIVYGTITGVDKNGEEIFEPAKPGQFQNIDNFFLENENFYRYFLEFNQDWVTFGNCFPELVFSKDRKTIARLVHQESSDCRFKQMNAAGVMDTVYLSKFWAGYDKQYVKSIQDDKLKFGTAEGALKLPKDDVDDLIVKELPAVDMYNKLEHLKEIAEQAKKKDSLNSVILPVNYPSTGKTYYQSPVWDAVRLSGWMEIASKVPAMLKALYTNAFSVKYHIEVPETYFDKRVEGWDKLDTVGRREVKAKFVKDLDTFFAGAEKNGKNLVSFFDTSAIDYKDYNHIKITELKNESTVSKDLILSSAINQEILFALQINPNMIGAGAPGGAYTGGAGSGSDIREAFLVYCALLHLERQIILEPIKLAARFNGFDPKVVFRFKDIVLTTLDQNSGTKEVLS